MITTRSNSIRTDPTVDPLARIVTGALLVLLVTAVAALLFMGSRVATSPTDALTEVLDRLVLPAGAALVAEQPGATWACEGDECAAVQRTYTLDLTPDDACTPVRRAVGAWGGTRLQPLATASCGYLGVHGAHRLEFSVRPTTSIPDAQGVPTPIERPHGAVVVLELAAR